MASPTVQLTDEAVSGIIVSPEHARALAELPVTVKLGRNRPRVRPLTLSLEKYLGILGGPLGAPIPSAVDYYTKAAPSIARMFRNDALGCCVISGKAHALGVWSTGDTDSGPVVLPSDAEITSQYSSVCGPGDNGCYIPDVLDYMVQSGFAAGGKKYKLDGYAAVDWTSKDLTRTAIAVFGALCIGINLPSAWTSAAVWDVTGTGIVGGHDVTPCGYGVVTAISTNAEGVVISSWGRLYLITWNAWVSKKWLEECYVMVPAVLWTGVDQRSPLGLDLAALRADMAALKGGNIPPLPDPVPPPIPPVPPSPPTPPPVPPVPPVPPSPVVVHGIIQTAPYVIPARTVSVQGGGLLQRGMVTIPETLIPGQTIPVNLSSGAAGASREAVPWGLIVAALRKFGDIAIPIIEADLAAGKGWAEILADLEAKILG